MAFALRYFERIIYMLVYNSVFNTDLEKKSEEVSKLEHCHQCTM